jgi:hypothetical protein
MMPTKARCTRTGIRLAIGLGAVGPLLLFGAAGVAASPASEAPPDGTYLANFSDGYSVQWAMSSSCGPNCVHIDGSNSISSDARFNGSNWSFAISGPAAATCPDGTGAAGAQIYEFNSETLTGTKTSSFKRWADCNGHPGGEGQPLPQPITFTMTKMS